VKDLYRVNLKQVNSFFRTLACELRKLDISRGQGPVVWDIDETPPPPTVGLARREEHSEMKTGSELHTDRKSSEMRETQGQL
jgi:hypothetical protein